MLKIMLNSEQNNTCTPSKRYAEYINCKKQRRTEFPAHQNPYAEQRGVVPEHMPILSGRIPIARFITGGMRLHRYIWVCCFLSDNVEHKADTALGPSKAWGKNQINKARKGRGRDTALVPVTCRHSSDHFDFRRWPVRD